MQDITSFISLQNFLQHGTGQPLELTCKKKIEDLECYPEANMRLTLVSIQGDGDDVMKLLVSYERYDEYNKQFECHDYFDRDGNPTMTAREKGFYKVNDVLYVMANDNPNDYFSVLQSKAYVYWLSLKHHYPNKTYVEWLEHVAEKKLEL